jgi:hypothetical protein
VGMSVEDAKLYAATAAEMHPLGLTKLQEQFDNRRRFFQEKVKPIRHRVFAHRERISTLERDDLFTNLRKRSFEDLVVFPLRLHRALFQLYHDGREPILDDDAPSNIGEAMRHLPSRGTNTWEHLHAARDAAVFLEWVKAAPRRG